MTGTEKSTARPSPQSGFEIELIPYPDCIEVQTLKVTSLDNGTCIEIDGCCLRGVLKAFRDLTPEDIRQGKRIRVQFFYPPTKERAAESRTHLLPEYSA